jgi:hypothetical protein
LLGNQVDCAAGVLASPIGSLSAMTAFFSGDVRKALDLRLDATNLMKLKARAEFVGDFEDMKKVSDLLRLVKKPENRDREG